MACTVVQYKRPAKVWEMADATLFRLQCTKMNLSWGTAQTQLVELTALPRPLADGAGLTAPPQEPHPVLGY